MLGIAETWHLPSPDALPALRNAASGTRKKTTAWFCLRPRLISPDRCAEPEVALTSAHLRKPDVVSRVSACGLALLQVTRNILTCHPASVTIYGMITVDTQGRARFAGGYAR